uniref:Uncharacterized protein n=2 Tax=Aegilops tauschii subsp. strangulata TaxID=200361 RepID=A0A453LJ08_AEGTS
YLLVKPYAHHTAAKAAARPRDGASLRSKHMAYSMTAASQGSVILPSSPPTKLNSSWDIIRSSPKTAVLRYASGTSNRTLSAVYTTQWPFIATDGEVVQRSSLAAPSAAVVVWVSLFLPMAAILCHFFAI